MFKKKEITVFDPDVLKSGTVIKIKPQPVLSRPVYALVIEAKEDVLRYVTVSQAKKTTETHELKVEDVKTRFIEIIATPEE